MSIDVPRVTRKEIILHDNAAGFIHILQVQYVFIHKAMLEAIRCGNTEIPADQLHSTIKNLEQINPATDKTLYQEQFEVSVYVQVLFLMDSSYPVDSSLCGLYGKIPSLL